MKNKTIKEVKFCPCGMPLIRNYNKKYDGKIPGYCNKDCHKRYTREPRQKVRKRYGLTGYIYDSYRKDDIFRKRERVDNTPKNDLTKEVCDEG